MKEHLKRAIHIGGVLTIGQQLCHMAHSGFVLVRHHLETVAIIREGLDVLPLDTVIRFSAEHIGIVAGSVLTTTGGVLVTLRILRSREGA